MKKSLAVCLGVLICGLLALQAQEKKDGPSRSVQGAVAGLDEKAAKGAVVYLKNLKNLQVRTFITRDDGTYYFHDLSPDIDYELHAESQTQGAVSATRKLSSFDSRKEAVVNLKLAKK